MCEIEDTRFEDVLAARRAYYADNPDAAHDEPDTDAIEEDRIWREENAR